MGKPFNEYAVSVKYFKELSNEDIRILKAEAVFVKDYCGPIDDTLLLLEGLKYSTAHMLYLVIEELVVYFKILQSALSIKEAVPAIVGRLVLVMLLFERVLPWIEMFI